jgi:hypothetical protein
VILANIKTSFADDPHLRYAGTRIDDPHLRYDSNRIVVDSLFQIILSTYDVNNIRILADIRCVKKIVCSTRLYMYTTSCYYSFDSEPFSMTLTLNDKYYFSGEFEEKKYCGSSDVSFSNDYRTVMINTSTFFYRNFSGSFHLLGYYENGDYVKQSDYQVYYVMGYMRYCGIDVRIGRPNITAHISMDE